MPINRTAQQQILAAATRDGSLPALYWYPVDTSGRHDRAVTLGHAAPAIPVIPVAPDPEISRHHAHLLISLLELPGAAFALDLTTADLLNQVGVPWFVYGDHDHICPGCAAVGDHCICTPLAAPRQTPPFWSGNP